MAKQFQLWVRVLRWVDGDTFAGILDHGCTLYRGTEAKPIRYRCALINAPEMSTPAGAPALDHAASLAPLGEYPCWSTGLDEYGRPLLDLILSDGRRFSDAMLAAGHAIPYR